MELLIVIFIIAVVASVGGGNYKAQRRVINYNDSIVKTSEMIKAARNNAITSASYWDEATQTNIVPEEGYGVYIEQNDTPGQSKIILFANTAIDTDDEKQKKRYIAGDDIILEEYILPIDTDFMGIYSQLPSTLINGANYDDRIAIIFRPPLAEASLTVNDNLLSNLVELDEVYMEFRRPETPSQIPSKYIHFNRISGFPEITD